MKYNHFLIIALFAYLGILPSLAKEKELFLVRMEVKNEITRHKVSNLTCLLYKRDSDGRGWSMAEDASVEFLNGVVTGVFHGKPESGQYRFYIIPERSDREQSMGGARYDERYERAYVVIDNIPEETKEEYVMPTHYIQKKRTKELNEVSVTASKVMFYHKGDTLVYNADAFLLSDGSMLDGLLAQMPGVELRRNGEIICNGKRIQQLLLNGKDVFNGRNGLMLENLEAYTVKDIAVYTKYGRVSEMMGQDAGDALHVMNVRLKREYSHGVMASAEGGYGTETRYLGKLFGLWFSDNVSMTANAGANNLSDSRNAGEKDNIWSTSQMNDGLFSTEMGGLSYLANGPEDRWELKGSFDVSHTRNNNYRRTLSEFFSDVNQITSHSEYNWRNDRIKYSTSHNMIFKAGDRIVMKVVPRFTFTNHKMNDSTKTETFNGIEELIVNRLKEENETDGKEMQSYLELESTIRLKSSGLKNMLQINLSSEYTSRDENSYNRYSLALGENTKPEGLSHRYYHSDPDYKLEAKAKLEFTQFLPFWKMRLPITYKYAYTEDKKDSRAYQLNELVNYDPLTWALDFNGNTTDFLSTFNQDQSYISLQRKHLHSIGIYLDPNKKIYTRWAGHYVSFTLSASLDLSHQFFNYIQYDATTYHRTDILPHAFLSLNLGANQVKTWEYNLFFEANKRSPDMTYLVSRPSRDPLVVYAGDDKLKNSTNYTLTLGTNYKSIGSKRHAIRLTANYAINETSNVFKINEQDGIKTATPTNSKFRLNTILTYDMMTPLKYNSPFVISTLTNARFMRRIDLWGYTAYELRQKLQLDWRKKQFNLSAFVDGRGRINQYSNQLNDFKTLELRYGTKGLVKLPHNWDISTDINIFTRKGFAEAQFNTTEFVWNMHISKSIMKGNLIFAIDGYDLLHQISHRTFSETYQSRIESETNGVPAYILFHVRYQFRHNSKR